MTMVLYAEYEGKNGEMDEEEDWKTDFISPFIMLSSF